MKKSYFHSILLILVFAIIAGCGGGMISIKMLEPAEFSLPGIKTVAVMDFRAVRSFGMKPSEEVGVSLTQALLDNQFYKVIERSELQKVVGEHELTILGLTAESASQKVGQLLGADAIITGTISDYSFRDSGEYRTRTKTDPETKKKISERCYYAQRVARIELNFKIISVSTGEIIASKTFDKSTSSKVSKPTKLAAAKALSSGFSMLSGMQKKMTKQFVNMIAPHTIYKSERLLTGKDPRLKEGVKFAQNALWDNAAPMWEEVAKAGIPKDQKAALYNLAVAYQAQAMYDDAIKYIDQALKFGADKLVMRKKNELYKLKADREKLLEQLTNR